MGYSLSNVLLLLFSLNVWLRVRLSDTLSHFSYLPLSIYLPSSCLLMYHIGRVGQERDSNVKLKQTCQLSRIPTLTSLGITSNFFLFFFIFFFFDNSRLPLPRLSPSLPSFCPWNLPWLAFNIIIHCHSCYPSPSFFLFHPERLLSPPSSANRPLHSSRTSTCRLTAAAALVVVVVVVVLVEVRTVVIIIVIAVYRKSKVG